MRRAMHGRAAWAVALAGAASVSACNLVVGVNDYKIEGEAGETDGTTTEPDAEADSTPPPIDAAPPTKDAGNPADANEGDVTLVGDARADGSVRDARPDGIADAEAGTTSTPDTGAAEGGSTCGQTLPSGPIFQHMVSACVAATGCDPYFLPFSLSDCIGSDLLGSTGDAGVFSCLQGATDCAAYFQCQGTRYASNAECPSDTSRCVGTNAIDCSGSDPLSSVPPPGTVTDCAKTGGTCQTYVDQFGDSRAGCIIVPSCDPSNTDQQCNGNDLFSCVGLADGGGIGDGRSCGAAVCTANSTNGAGCSFARDICLTGTGTTCSGNDVTCTASGQATSYSCARAGGVCRTSAGVSSCLLPGCANSGCSESCDSTGTTATACVGGSPTTIPCTQFQFSPTDAYSGCTTNSASGVAYCVP